MFGFRAIPNLIAGHCGESFPHVCPGIDCAIYAWLERKTSREKYDALEHKAVGIIRANGKTTP